MELHLDASIDKLDNLAMNVQFDKEKRMEQTKDKEPVSYTHLTLTPVPHLSVEPIRTFFLPVLII